MKCLEYNELILKSIDGLTNDLDEAKLKHHIKTCQLCREEYNSMNEMLNTMDEELSIEPPIGFENLIMEKIKDYEEKKLRGRFGVLMLCYNLVIIVIIAVLGIVFIQKSGWAYETALKLLTYLYIIPDLIISIYNNTRYLLNDYSEILSITFKTSTLVAGVIMILLSNVKGIRILDSIKKFAGNRLLVLMLVILATVSLFVMIALAVIIPALYFIIISIMLVMIIFLIGEIALFKSLKRMVFSN
jgi:hypothetical protein